MQSQSPTTSLFVCFVSFGHSSGYRTLQLELTLHHYQSVSWFLQTCCVAIRCTQPISNLLCLLRYTMTKTTAVLFILFFSLVFRLEEPVSDFSVHVFSVSKRMIEKVVFRSKQFSTCVCGCDEPSNPFNNSSCVCVCRCWLCGCCFILTGIVVHYSSHTGMWVTWCRWDVSR